MSSSKIGPKLALLLHYLIQRTASTFHPWGWIVIMHEEPNAKAGMTETSEQQYPHQRISRRAKIARPLRVRPSEPREQHFDDLPVSVNASKEGIYFTSRQKSYYKGMRVFVTFPFSSLHDPMNCEYVAEVVRVEELPHGKLGIAVHLMMTMNYSSSAPPGSVTRA